MPNLLTMMLPHFSNATVCAAVTHLAVGMSGFKVDDPARPDEAATVLPLTYKFIKAVLPFCDKAFTAMSDKPGQTCKSSQAQLATICDILMLSIKTFESAVEVTIRCGVQETHELARYRALQSIVH